MGSEIDTERHAITNIKKGKIVGYQCGKVTAIKWKDNKCILLLSTIHTLDCGKKEKIGEIKQKPKNIVDYNDIIGEWTNT